MPGSEACYCYQSAREAHEEMEALTPDDGRAAKDGDAIPAHDGSECDDDRRNALQQGVHQLSENGNRSIRQRNGSPSTRPEANSGSTMGPLCAKSCRRCLQP